MKSSNHAEIKPLTPAGIPDLAPLYAWAEECFRCASKKQGKEVANWLASCSPSKGEGAELQDRFSGTNLATPPSARALYGT